MNCSQNGLAFFTMLSQNTAYLTNQGTMMLQKLTLLWMMKEKERKKMGMIEIGDKEKGK